MNTCGVDGRLFRISSLLFFLMVCLSSCASNSGIFAGGKWQSGGLQHRHIRSLAVDPNNPQVIYAGDAQGGVFVSTNAGMNWNQQYIGFTLPITIFALAFDDPGKKLYAATNSGLFVSADAAAHWIKINGLPVDSYTSVAFDLLSPHIIYTATEQHGVYVSTNEGSTWTAANNGLPSGIIIHNLAFDSVQHQLWAAANVGIYRTGDAGKLWQVLNNGLPSKVDANTILPAAISGGEKGLVFAGTNHGFFISKDNGAQWSPSQESLTGTSVTAILIDYHKVTTVYAGTSIGVLRSNDNGQNWGGIASGLPRNEVVQALAIGANGYNQLYAAINDIYLFPGNSGAFDPSQIFPILLVLAFFFALYQITSRRRKHSQFILNPERIAEPKSPSPHEFSQGNVQDKTQTSSRFQAAQERERMNGGNTVEGKQEEI